MKERHTVCGELSELMKQGGQFAQNPYGGRKRCGSQRRPVCLECVDEVWGQAEVGEVG